jgi:Zn-dependent metalloprotease
LYKISNEYIIKTVRKQKGIKMKYEIKVNENKLVTESIENVKDFINMIDDSESVIEWHLAFDDKKLDCKDRFNAVAIFNNCMGVYNL